MNKRGNIMLNLLLFLMGLGVFVIFISPLTAFLGITMQSDNLNCQGYIYNGDVNNSLSYNASLQSNTLACLAMKLYLPYLALAFLIAGVSKILYDRVGQDTQDFGGL